VFTTSRHWSLSWAEWIHSVTCNPISLITILILSSCLCVHLGLPNGLFLSGFKTNFFVRNSRFPHAFYIHRPSHPRFHYPCNNMFLVSSTMPKNKGTEKIIRYKSIFSRCFQVLKLYVLLPSRRKSRDSSAGVALGYGLDDRCSRFRLPAGAGNFSLHHRVQNGFETHPSSYPMGTGGSFFGGKAAVAWSWPLTSI
jgi:hypothetical protein